MRVILTKKIPVHPEARNTVVQFQAALGSSDWQRALSFCSEEVKIAADAYGSPAEFFQTVVPVEQMLKLYTFDLRGPIQFVEERGEYRVDWISEHAVDPIEVSGYKWTIPVLYDMNDEAENLSYYVLKRKDAWEIIVSNEPVYQWYQEKKRLREFCRKELEKMERKMKWRRWLHLDFHQYKDPLFGNNTNYRARNIFLKQQDALCKKAEAIRLKLQADKQVYRLNEPILLSLKIANTGDNTLYYGYSHVAGALTILDQQDRFILDHSDNNYYRQKDIKTIGPHQEEILFEKYDIREHYTIKEPGSYTIEYNGQNLVIGGECKVEAKNIWHERIHELSHGIVVEADMDFISNSIKIEIAD